MRAVPALLLLPLVACSEYSVNTLCGTNEMGFDIEEASVLEDAQGYPGMHDAVILTFDDSALSPGARWRVSAVEILPMIPASLFGSVPDGQTVGIEVWDSDNPHSTPWRVDQVFDVDALEWSDELIPNGTEAVEADQKAAWWKFEFDDVIPIDGMTGPDYLVGVTWGDTRNPPLGYSNFNRSCALNWTDYDDGFGWVLNSDAGSLDECSWPMLRVYMQIIDEQPECSGESVPLE